jgi:SAM-dependent methyltransferase
VADEQARARSFGAVAEEYERIRPGYPAELVDDVLAYAGGGPALEVGAGTGKATLDFADRGVAVTAVEPDPQMAAVLARRLGDRPGVRLRVAAFEDIDGSDTFTLLYSGQAWHWTDPETRWTRAASLLRPGGALALFWNFEEPAEAADLAAVRELRAAIAPGMDTAAAAAHRTQPTAPDGAPWPMSDLVAVPEFGAVTEREYHWSRRLAAADCTALLNTHSDYRMLDETTRQRLLEAIAAALPASVEVAVETRLYLARRLPH